MTRRFSLLAFTGLVSSCTRRESSPVPDTQGITDPTQPIRSGIAVPKEEIEFSYALEIPDQQGNPITVQDTFKFRSGERFRLQWKANFAAFVYVFNRGPRTNAYVRLFPAFEQGSMIGASTDVAAHIPKSTGDWMRFDTIPGDEQMILIASRAAIPAFETDAQRFTVDQFDRLLITLERSSRPRSLRRFDEGHWHKCIAAGPQADLAVVSRLPLYHA